MNYKRRLKEEKKQHVTKQEHKKKHQSSHMKTGEESERTCKFMAIKTST